MLAVVSRELERTPNARPGPFPRAFRPQLATLVSTPPEGDQWVHEIKYDGYRIGALVERGKVRLVSRNEKDWTARFPAVASAIAQLSLDRAVIDGEVVALDAEGRPDFQTLQNAMGIEGERPSTRPVIVYYAFDLPYCEGYDLKRSPLVERKKVLAKLVEAEADRARRAIYFSEHVAGRGREVWERACASGLEGIISKRADSSYEPRRTRTWLKTKCLKRQELVIGGYTDPQGSREGFGSLLVGYYDDEDQLIFCGAVGTGFDARLLRSLHRELKAREIDRSPFVNPPPRLRGARGMRWIRPELVAEVEFTEWTADGILRHPSFKGLRHDKPPETVRRELPAGRVQKARGTSVATKAASPKPTARSRGRKGITEIGSVRVSRPERVLWPDLGITKRELIEYWHDVSDRALAEIAGRPLSLLRCPEGTEGECFWQKQRMDTMPDAILGVDLLDDGEARTYIAIDSREGLLSLAQLGALEIHPWSSRTDALERPDRVIFDLDPGPGTSWTDVTTAAHELRAFLEMLGLVSVARVTGGKGLHVIVPLARRQGWEEVKAFARGVANTFSRGAPRRFTAVATKARRTGRIYIDWLRNSRGATAIATWSPRARPGAPVAVPVGWDEVGPELRPDGFDFDRARRRASEPDPWTNALSRRQTITPRRLEAVGE